MAEQETQDPCDQKQQDEVARFTRSIQVKLQHALAIVAAIVAFTIAIGGAVHSIAEQITKSLDEIREVQEHLHANDMRLDAAGAPAPPKPEAQ